MQLRLDAADRLVELVEERRGPVSAEEAARRLFALRSAPVGLARSLLEEVVASDARVAWRGDCVGLEQPLGADLPLERATYVLVAHNARFDLGFLDRETERLTGARLAGPVVDTVGLARRLLAGRTRRAGLASLAQFFGTAARPCHRALPDAQATAEILLRLLGLAQERGATTVADLAELAAPRVRKVYAKRSLAFGAPTSPGVYLFRDRNDQVLYVGRARDLRARLRSYFRTDRQRPAVEGALAALERIEWRVAGSELEAALEELRLIREFRPPG